MTKLLSLPESLPIQRCYGFAEDFLEFVSGDLFTDTSADSGAAVAPIDGSGGLVTLTTGGTDNNECYLLATKECFLFAADRPMVFEARLKYTEANTDDANLCLGFMDAVAADSILDDGGGPAASYSGAVFFKVDGGTKWNCEASIGGTQTGTVLLSAANTLDGLDKVAGGGVFQILRIEVAATSPTSAVASFWINGVCVQEITFTYTGATEMKPFVGVKAGGANSEVVTVDYVAAYQLR